MIYSKLASFAVALALVSSATAAFADPTPGAMASGSAMAGSMPGSMTGPDHGMPVGTAGGDGHIYTGKPDLDAAVSLVTAGGPIGSFDIAKALTALVGAKATTDEVAKLKKQYGADAFTSYVTVQDYAVNDAVAKATAAGVKFPTPTLMGADLAKRITTLGVYNGTYYEGYMLDHIVTHNIHVAVMDDIDKMYGTAADANYHKIADQAHYDLAQALGATTVGLAAFH